MLGPNPHMQFFWQPGFNIRRRDGVPIIHLFVNKQICVFVLFTDTLRLGLHVCCSKVNIFSTVPVNDKVVILGADIPGLRNL